jgi:tRNA(fMet)-specific endonuclease VapC
MIILDSDHVTLLEWGGIPCGRIGAYLDLHDPQAPPRTTLITYEEQLRGWFARLSSAKSLDEQLRIYAKLDGQRRYFHKLDIVPFDAAAATHYQRLLKLKIRIGTMDLKIAAIALAHDAILLTRNRRDFAKVPGLKFHNAAD